MDVEHTVQDDEAQNASRRGAPLMPLLQRVLYMMVATSLPVFLTGVMRREFMVRFLIVICFGVLTVNTTVLKLTDGYSTSGLNMSGMCFV